MLTSFAVDGFKSLQNVEIPLGQVNVFIGANGSGKSNLLEALGFLSSAADGKLDDQALLRRGVRPSAPLLYRCLLPSAAPDSDISLQATLAFGRNRVDYAVRLLNPSNGRDDAWHFRDERSLLGASGKLEYHGGRVPAGIVSIPNEPDTPERWVMEPESITEALTILADYAIFAPNAATLRGMATDITQRVPVGLAGGQLAEAVEELLKPKRKFGTMNLDELFNLLDWVSEISVAPPSRELVSASVPTARSIIRFTDRRMAEGRNRLSAYDASEGALYVLFALVLALHPKSPRLFAIENLDQNMHPRLARATVRTFSQQILKTKPERQVLLTTHNPLVLDGLDLRDERIRLFTVERKVQGATRVDRVTITDEMLQAVEGGLSLSDLWVMGRLGGAPDLF